MTYVVMMKKYSIKDRQLSDGVIGKVLGCDLLRMIQFESDSQYGVGDIIHIPFDCHTKTFQEELGNDPNRAYRIIGKEHVIRNDSNETPFEDYIILEVNTLTARTDNITVDGIKHDVSSPTVIELFEKRKGLTILT